MCRARVVMRPTYVFWACLCLLCLCTSPALGARPPALMMEARALASTLMSASSDEAGEMAIQRILERLDAPILSGNEHRGPRLA